MVQYEDIGNARDYLPGLLFDEIVAHDLVGRAKDKYHLHDVCCVENYTCEIKVPEI